MTVDEALGTRPEPAATWSAPAELVIPLRTRPRAVLKLAVLSAVLSGGAAVWIALAPSFGSIVFGGLTIALFAWLWVTRTVAERLRGDAPAQIVVTKQGLSSPLWSLDWDRVGHMWIGTRSSGKLKALNIEPIRPEDIKQARSGTLRFNLWLNTKLRQPGIQIYQLSVDRPLEELAAEMVAIAGRD